MLREKRLFLFDIDGTVSVESDWLDGSLELFRYIEKIGGRSIFITNNSTKSIRDYVEKFARMGVPAGEDQFVTASRVTALYLKEHYRGKKIFVLGTGSFLAELRGQGLLVTDTLEEDIACAVVGYDDELTYQKAAALCRLLQTREVDYLATNPDLACPAAFGMVPDCGAICGMIECAVNRKPLYLGKPGPAMVELSLAATGFTKEQTLVVGDRLYTDIACGINAGVETAVVFTGEAKPADLADTVFPPTYAFAGVRELLEAIKKEAAEEAE